MAGLGSYAYHALGWRRAVTVSYTPDVFSWAQAAAFLEKANVLTAMDNVVWDSAWLLSDSSILGKALHTLIGYTDQPTAMQLAVYLAILAVTFVLMRLYGAPAKTVRPAPAE